VAKRGIVPSTHAVIYSAGGKPYTSPNEPRLTKDPLAVEIISPAEKLDRMSRIDFGKIHTVEHNVKVWPIGKIARESMPKLKEYAREGMTDWE